MILQCIGSGERDNALAEFNQAESACLLPLWSHNSAMLAVIILSVERGSPICLAARASLKSLMIVCRSLASMLEAGVDVKKAFEICRNKLADASMRRTISDIETQIRQGSDISAAMEDHVGLLAEIDDRYGRCGRANRKPTGSAQQSLCALRKPTKVTSRFPGRHCVALYPIHCRGPHHCTVDYGLGCCPPKPVAENRLTFSDSAWSEAKGPSSG